MHHRQNRLIQAALVFGILLGCQALVLAQPSTNNQRPASVLFYNKYISNMSNPQLQDTQINITNTNPNDPIAVHMFFVDGSTCSIADFFLNLTPNQTSSFRTSDFDPGIVGYIVAVASDGGPTQFNWLVGDEYIREEDGKVANLQAYGVTKLTPGGVSISPEGRARMTFDGVEYDQLPSSVAVSSFNSQVTHNTTLNIYSPSSNLQTGNPVSNNIFTIVFNDSEDPFSTSVRFQCYGVIPLSSLRVTGGNVNVIVPAGRTGWIRLNGATRPLLGATIQRGPVFNGGHNLFPITYLPTYTIDVPNF